MSVVVKVENVSKKYHLGKTGTNSLKGDFQRWWALKRGKDDPFSKVVEASQLQGDEFWALKDINFEIKQGEAIGIIGKNGAGKSTLLKILSRITLPTTGSIKVKGRIASLLEVGTGFNPDLSGRENVYLNGAILGMTKGEITKKFDEIVDFSGIERFIDTPVKRYSSGMYVRLAFAVAAHLESEILILDEVLAVGDADFQRKCLGKMDDVAHKQGRTIIFVSHTMSAVTKLCNSGILLSKGTLIKSGEINEVADVYRQKVQSRKEVIKSGKGGIKVLDLHFRDVDGNTLSMLSTFGEVFIDVTYEAQESFRNVGFAVCFNNSLEVRAMSLYTPWIGKEYNVNPGTFKVTFHVPSLKLIPGEYDIISYIGSENQPIETLENFRQIIIGFTKQFGLVVEPKSSQGFYVEDFEVNMNQLESSLWLNP
ncbi:ABC transporter ATP-binding protein [Xanthocytophaga agilis]|uniref:ABC transporter ATP-binding protein n=1 Tax=Xanthocytophaga agilis TaxID=3048010 RepID=A0AAE3R2X2_9BACT|nr:ABC transporter ATP-binding protein [Xanthocytophaga agilis]MDJ1502175.1 ABC transporter ATP-binding protein [Xanthocytophaga agilis]